MVIGNSAWESTGPTHGGRILKFLFIDTCTERGMIAYGNHEELLFERELPFGLTQSKFLMPYLNEALTTFGLPPPLEAIGVGVGPGSYTGIRLGVAVAQALAYAWHLPLVGISSMEGLVPSTACSRFASLIDARIGGVYFQQGRYEDNGLLSRTPPQVIPLDAIGQHLEEVSLFVTPYATGLQGKLAPLYPEKEWAWEERAPSARIALQNIEAQYRAGQYKIPPEPLELLYLRQTEAERRRAHSATERA